MTDEGRLQRWLDTHRAVVATHPSPDHIDVDTLARHASGQLSAAKARIVSEHLLACDDGRCGDFVRSQATDIDSAGELLYPESASENSEQMRQRTFQSREIVWSTFESMARELNAPIDDLVNEAMAAYAKVRGYAAEGAPAGPALGGRPAPVPAPMSLHLRGPASDRDPLEETHDAPSISALDRSYSPPRAPDPDHDDLAQTAARASFTRPAAGRPPIDHLREPGEESRTTPRLRAASLPVPAALSRPVMGPGLPPPPARTSPNMAMPRPGAPPPGLPPRLMPPSTQRMPEVPREMPRESSSPGMKRLVLSYQGRSYNVEKERFLLGRSKTQADLRLDDPNVSRQHAVIERVGAAWYIVDLGSTNGVHVAGERVARRALSDGDVLVITSHEIRCSLR
jgi:hypothetical protein